MSVIDIDLAMKHLLAEPDDQALVQAQLDAAEDAAMMFLQRRLFVDQAALDTAQAGLSAQMLAARLAYNQAMAAATEIEDLGDRASLWRLADQTRKEAAAAIDAIGCGIIVNSSIIAACLLKVGHLFANREEVVTGTIATELPLASKSLLMPYRIRMGV